MSAARRGAWPAFTEEPALCRSADPLDALEIAIFSDGDELGWHFDNSEFSVTVMYQQATTGGHFEYCPGSAAPPNPPTRPPRAP